MPLYSNNAGRYHGDQAALDLRNQGRKVAATPHIRLASLWAAMIVIACALAGCGPAIVGGVTLGASVLHDRRTTGTVVDDQQIEITATHIFYQTPEFSQRARINVTSYDYVVLLTGQSEEPGVSARFAERVAAIPKVKRVVDEVTVGPLATAGREATDVAVTSRVKLALAKVRKPGFDLTRVKVVTEAGVVYLMGLLHPDEIDPVVETVRYVPGVKRVVTVFQTIG